MVPVSYRLRRGGKPGKGAKRGGYGEVGLTVLGNSGMLPPRPPRSEWGVTLLDIVRLVDGPIRGEAPPPKKRDAVTTRRQSACDLAAELVRE